MLNLLRRLNFLLDSRDRRVLLLFLVLFFISSILEILGIGIVVPFLALLNDDTLIASNKYFKEVYSFGGFTSYSDFLVAIGLGMAFLFLLKNAFIAVVFWLQTKFFAGIHHKIGKRLYASYLYADYAVALNRNSAQQLRNINIVAAIVHGILNPLVMIFSELLVSFLILCVLIKTNPLIALQTSVGLGLMGFVSYRALKNKLAKLGKKMNLHSEKLMKTINQSLGSFKETKIYQCEPYFEKGFSESQNEIVSALQQQSFWNLTPRLYIEVVLIFFVSAIMIMMIRQGLSSNEILMSVSLFAVASVRLMPSLSRISSSINMVRFYLHGLDEIFDDIRNSETFKERAFSADSQEIVQFRNAVQLSNLTFEYLPNKPVLKNISLSIPKNSLIGLAGSSGSGKTTLVDIICGLLNTKSGSVTIDGKNIRDVLGSWRKKVAYIPQRIYLLDDSIRNNVAFGVPENEIDDERVWRALKMAQIDVFVKNQPESLSAVVGENGAKVSGGQRQRLGIARALYFQPEILVMDEGTSALDNETEAAFMEALNCLAGSLTIIIIAHRLTTLQQCDTIFVLNDGQIVKAGTYQDLFVKVEHPRDAPLRDASLKGVEEVKV